MILRRHVLVCQYVDKPESKTALHDQHLQDVKTIANMHREVRGKIVKIEGLIHKLEMLLRRPQLCHQGLRLLPAHHVSVVVRQWI